MKVGHKLAKIKKYYVKCVKKFENAFVDEVQHDIYTLRY